MAQAGGAQDQIDDSLGNIVDTIISGHRWALAIAVLLNNRLHRLQDCLTVQPCNHDATRVEALGALHGIADGDRSEAKER